MSLNKVDIGIAKDFSRFPVGRDNNDGEFNGERFRKEILVPALKAYDLVSIFLDGPKSYGSSFLEEAFGGLVRKENFKKDELKRKLQIRYEAPVYELYKDEAWQYIDEA